MERGGGRGFEFWVLGFELGEGKIGIGIGIGIERRRKQEWKGQYPLSFPDVPVAI